MRVALYPGSFDPLTNGHMEVIRRATVLFDRLVVLVCANAVKHCTFSAQERSAMLRSCTQGLPNVTVEAYEGLVALYAKEIGATAIVKGLRNAADFEKEFQQAHINRQLNPQAETVLIPAQSGSMHISSTMVKQVCSLGGDIRALVPPEAYAQICAKMRQDT